MDRFALLFDRNRLLLAGCIVAYTGLCLYGASRLTFHHDPEKLFTSEKLREMVPDGDFASSEHAVVIVVEGEDLLTRDAVEVIRRVVQEASQVDGIASVFSMLSVRDRQRAMLPLFPPSEATAERFEQARRRAISHPLLIGQLLSEDRKTALVIAELDDRANGHTRSREIIGQLEDVLAEQTQGSSVRTRMTGWPVLEVEVLDNMRGDIRRFTRMGIALTLLIAGVLFRRVGAVLIVAAGPAVGVVWYVGTLGLLGVPINILTNIVPLLVLVIGFTDATHLVLHIRRALGHGSSGREAAQKAIHRLGLACGLTSFSTAIGFGSLALASTEGIRTFGLCCALGSVLSFFAVITVVPLLSSTPLSRFIATANTPGRPIPLIGLADRGLSFVLGHPRMVLTFTILLTLTLGLLATKLEPNHSVSAILPDSCEPYQALERIDEAFGGIMFAYAVVEWPVRPQAGRQGPGSREFYEVIEEVHAVFDENRVSSNPLSILNLVRSLPGDDAGLARRARLLRYVPERHLSRLIDSRKRHAIVSAHLPDIGARKLNPAFADMDRRFADIARRHPGYRVSLTGSTVAVFRGVHLIIEDLWRSLIAAAGVMFLMIWIGLRSFRYALASLIPNTFPLLCAGAFILLTGRYLEMSSVIVFSIALGIAVDDTIHFLVRFQHEMRLEANPPLAIRRTFRTVGTALVMTTVTLVAGHSVVMMSAFPSIRVFGMLASLTIASALVGDLLILPAILVCLRWPANPAPHQPVNRHNNPQNYLPVPRKNSILAS
jgi:predicted RND superfamily exporter protein